MLRTYVGILGSCLLLFLFFSTYEVSYAQQVQQGQPECQPTYGDYKSGDKWGWYGARKVVKNPAEAHQLLEKFFVHHRNLKVGKMMESIHVYQAYIINNKGALVDIIIIDKRTGRIRSAY
jgi:hypothetical protein